jgi:hypothetical protein
VAVAIAAPSPTLAAGFVPPQVPALVPDLGCLAGIFFGGGKCITFTESAAISQIQSEIMQAQNLTAMNGAALFNAVASQIATIAQTAQANPNSSGAAAATAAAQQAQEDAAKQAWLNGTGADASGAEQRAQIDEGNASILNSEIIAGNEMNGAQIQHVQKRENTEEALFDGGVTNATDAGG